MNATAASDVRKKLRALLRVARFQNWALDELEDEIDKLYGEGVDIQPADPATQQLGPA
jgi:hypothetical protein